MAALATAADAMVFLDGTKIVLVDGSPTGTQIDDTDAQNSAAVTILAYLAAKVDAATLGSWSGPSQTPAIIRTIAGRMVASKVYGRVYSQERTTPAPYALQLWNEAMAMLHDIICGNLTMYDLSGNAIVDTEHINEGNFQPNSTYPSSTRVPILANPDGSQNQYAFGMGSIF